MTEPNTLIFLIFIVPAPVPEQSKEVIHPKPHILDLVSTQRGVRQGPLLLLEFQDPVLDGLVDLELVDEDVTFLSVSMRPIEGLVLGSWNRVSGGVVEV